VLESDPQFVHEGGVGSKDDEACQEDRARPVELDVRLSTAGQPTVNQYRTANKEQRCRPDQDDSVQADKYPSESIRNRQPGRQVGIEVPVIIGDKPLSIRQRLVCIKYLPEEENVSGAFRLNLSGLALPSPVNLCLSRILGSAQDSPGVRGNVAGSLLEQPLLEEFSLGSFLLQNGYLFHLPKPSP
jgi:hypothetical protein